MSYKFSLVTLLQTLLYARWRSLPQSGKICSRLFRARRKESALGGFRARRKESAGHCKL